MVSSQLIHFGNAVILWYKTVRKQIKPDQSVTGVKDDALLLACDLEILTKYSSNPITTEVIRLASKTLLKKLLTRFKSKAYR